MDTIGEQLKQARINSGLTIDDLQRMTKIQSRYLVAIEANDFDDIPSDYYARTFIRQYADVVGINPAPLVKRFDAIQSGQPLTPQTQTKQIKQEQAQPEFNQAPPVRGSRKEKFAQQNKKEAKKGMYVPIIILVLIVAIIIGTIIYAIRLDTASGPLVPKPNKTTIVGSSDSSAKTEESSTKKEKESTEEEKKKEENVFTMESDNGDVITYKGTDITQPVKIDIEGLDGPSWVGVQESGTGNLFYQDTVNAGGTLTIDVPENIQNMDIIVGAANNVALKVNGTSIDFNKENPVTGTKSITLLLSTITNEQTETTDTSSLDSNQEEASSMDDNQEELNQEGW